MNHADYYLHGWRVRSERVLPELEAWAGAPDTPVDVAIAFAPVAELPDIPGGARQWLSVDAERGIVLSIPGVARFHIEGGTRITVDLAGDPAAVDWRTFLLGIVFGYLCHQRAVFALHASAVTVRGRTLAFAGASGAGKSTCAMALVRRGHTLLTDDLTVLARNETGVFVQPAFRQIKIWRNCLETVGIPPEGLERVRDTLEKFALQPPERFVQSPYRLDAILVPQVGPEPKLEAVDPFVAVPLVNRNIARPRVAKLLDRQAALLVEATAIAAKVPVLRFIRPLDLARLDEGAECIERVLAP